MDYKQKFEEAERYVQRLTKELNDLQIENARLENEVRELEIRYNPNHDPTNGRFTDSTGNGAGAVLYVGKGEKGKGAYVFNKTNETVDSGGGSGIIKAEESSKSTKFEIVQKRCEVYGVEYREVKPLTKELTTEEIIDKIGGGDETVGSCSSLAFAYAGNKNGLDVTDYRGGNSLEVFAEQMTIKNISQLPGVESATVKCSNDFKGARELLKTVDEGKEYYLSTGQHASIIRKTKTGFEYLELQSPTNNGFKPFETNTLKKRFGCQKSHSLNRHKMEVENILIDISSFKGNNEFKDLLGYLNTAPQAQMKGENGYVK